MINIPPTAIVKNVAVEQNPSTIVVRKTPINTITITSTYMADKIAAY